MVASFALLGALIVTAAGQIVFKSYSLDRRPLLLLVAITLFGGAPPLTYLAVKGLGVGLVYVATSVTYVVVALAGWRMFGERIDGRTMIAMGLIFAGVLTYGLGL